MAPSIKIPLHKDNCTSDLEVMVDGVLKYHEVCCEAEGDSLVVLGIVIGLLSSVAINVGQNIQALGAKEPGADKNPCSSRKWIIGLTIFVTGSMGNMVAMAFASATILVPLESSQVRKLVSPVS